MRLIAFTVLSLAIPITGWTQSIRPPARRGLTVTMGAAVSKAKIACASCGVPDRGGDAGTFAVGYADSNFVLSVQARRWREFARVDNDHVDFFLFGLQYFPIRGFFLEQAIGYGGIAMRDSNSHNVFRSGGLAYSMGLGYDLRMTRALSLSVFAHTMGVARREAVVNGHSANEEMNAGLNSLGLALTWQQSRRRRYIPAGER